MPFMNRPCWPTGVLCFLIASGFLMYVVQNSARVSLGLCGRLGHGSPEPDHLDGTKTTFRQMPVLEDMSHEGNEAWAAALMPPNQGLVPVRHNETFSLQVGISMFHALHCLGMLRTMLQARVDSHLDRRGDSHEHPTMGDEANKFLHGVHMPHCLSYIAQSIVCAADDTIETPWLEKDNDGNIVKQGIDGNGIEHQCKDATRLWKAANLETPLDPWAWKSGDTVASIFANRR